MPEDEPFIKSPILAYLFTGGVSALAFAIFLLLLAILSALEKH